MLVLLPRLHLLHPFPWAVIRHKRLNLPHNLAELLHLLASSSRCLSYPGRDLFSGPEPDIVHPMRVIPILIHAPKLATYLPAFRMLAGQLGLGRQLVRVLQMLAVEMVVPNRRATVLERSLLVREPLVADVPGTLSLLHAAGERVLDGAMILAAGMVDMSMLGLRVDWGALTFNVLSLDSLCVMTPRLTISCLIKRATMHSPP